MLRVSLLIAAAALAAACSPSSDDAAARHSATIGRYCLDCHDYAQQEGGLSLERVDLAAVPASAATWEKVISKLNAGLMPPPGQPRPDATTAESFVRYLERSLDAAAEQHPNPGRVGVHRLNRTEYGNAIRDLLALAVDPAEYLPADDEGYGFDNIADVLRVSPSLLEQYLAAAAKIAALAVGDPESGAVTSVYRAPPDLAQLDHVEGLPLGTRGGVVIRHRFPLDAEYDFGVFLLRNIVGYMTGLEWPHQLEIAVDGERVLLATVGGVDDNAMSDANFSAAADEIDRRLRLRVPVAAGEHEVSVAFLRKSAAETHEPLELHTRNLDLQDMNGMPVVDYVTITGPFAATGPGDTPSRRKIFQCWPESPEQELPCARTILAKLAYRAYRRPVTAEDLELLLDFFATGRERGTFETGVQNALRVMLTSPSFLFRTEPDPVGIDAGAVYPVDDLALASRLSFFLWSSLPDDELLGLAEHGRLSEPEEYARQVRRMLADPRADSLVDNFAGQWLYLRNLKSVRPDVEEFPDFDDNLRQAMRRETELLFEAVLREDRSATELLTADFTFLNERLARHYGVPHVYGSHFRRVAVSDPSRRGLLGHASILTVTSYPNRTSPVLRGKWILENVLGTPAPTPPPNVPALEENEAGKAARSMRERLEDHRVNPVCAGCHDVMDPIGLALENFDAIGGFRTVEAGGVVDASGHLADGTAIDGPVALREALTATPEQFASVLAEKLLIYALGRGLEPFDMPTVRAVVRRAAADDYRFSSLVVAIADSVPFRMKVAAD